MTVENIELKCRGGGSLSIIKPKFSACEESIYVARKNCILQYSTKTGLLLSQYQDLKNAIVGFDVVNLNSVENLIACTEDCEIAVWKTITHFKTVTKKIECSNIKSFHYLPCKHEDNLEAIISYAYKDKTSIALVDISKGSFKKFKLKLKENQVIIGINPRRFFAVIEKDRIHFISVDNPEKRNSVSLNSKNQSPKYFTCLECHSKEEIVVTGDSEGQVLLWYDIFSNNPARSIYHWHTLPVNCLAFSATGSFFYSGGNESVLVRWDWENTQNRKFLPRLSGNIQHIRVSSQSQLVAVSTSDNAIRILDSAFNEISLIQHLVVGDNYKCGITLDPRTKALIMNGSIGQIQFYQPKTESLLYSMDVVGQNKLTNERNFSVENTQVIKFAISKNGLWLATVEERRDPQCDHYELRLKFWNFNSSQQIFELNTSIEKPHHTTISSIAFQFSNRDEDLKCITIGADKKFKVWNKIIVEHVNIKQIAWNCLSIGFYKDLPCRGLSFSADGSLMGIGFGPIVTTWTPDTCQLKCSLVYTVHKSDIEDVQFGTSNQCHLLVAAAKDRLSVWNLLTLTMIWTVPLEVKLLLANRLSIYMAVITEGREIFVFSPNSPIPVYSSNEILASRVVVAAAFIPTPLCQDNQSKWFERVELYLIDSNKELFSIGTESSEEYWPHDYINDMTEGTSLYHKMMPFKKVSSTSVEQRKHLFKKDVSKKVIKQYLDAPVHTMIPIRLNCSSLIKSFLVQKSMPSIRP